MQTTTPRDRIRPGRRRRGSAAWIVPLFAGLLGGALAATSVHALAGTAVELTTLGEVVFGVLGLVGLAALTLALARIGGLAARGLRSAGP